MTGYAFNLKSHGVFTPEGKQDMSSQQAEDHNKALEQSELDLWATKPERWQVYVGANREVTTWTGKVLGTIIERNTYRGNIARNMTSIRFQGTNGAVYYGRYGSDWSQLCRVRKAK